VSSADDYPYDLGAHRRVVTTTSAQAQLWFDRGLNWCFGYHHGEAIACFEQALWHDPKCNMARWGIALALGPTYNKPWSAFDEPEKRDAVERANAEIEAALSAADAGAPVERALVRAITHRYPKPMPAPDADAWDAANAAYAAAMREVYAEFPDDLDVTALFVEAMLVRTPSALWDIETGEPAAGADTVEAREVLERAFASGDATARRHPGLLHMYLHLTEMSPEPEQVLWAADVLRDLVPDAGHLRHMPSHIDVLCGDWQTAVRANDRAIAADEKYLGRAGPLNFYSLYRCHNYHLKIHAAMMQGCSQVALAAADAMAATLPVELLQMTSPLMADWLEGYLSVRQHVLIRFGRWRAIIRAALPDDPELYAMTTAMQRYAKAVAHAAQGDISAAEREQAAFHVARTAVPPTRSIGSSPCPAILEVAAAMLAGELAYRRGAHEQAFAALRRAVALEDALPYDEPWGWMQPTRHALGALLLEQGRVGEAEAVYRADLGLDPSLPRGRWHPDNVWSLHGFHECLAARGDPAAGIVEQRLHFALARADVTVGASCYCRGASLRS
jgi:tetratricopeptide (TPR) repeat protein